MCLGWLGFGNAKGPAWLLSTQNLFALAVERLGIDPGQFGLGAREAIILMGLWGAVGGGNMLLYLAALTNVPKELQEAAELDGATRWQQFWKITLPMLVPSILVAMIFRTITAIQTFDVTWPQLAPTTFFIVVMGFIGGLQGGFEQARVMTGGGPAGTTTTLAYYIYNKAFTEFQMGYASAVALVLFALIFAVTLINWKFGNKELNY